VGRASRALSEFRLDGVTTNIPFLCNILAHDDFAAGRLHTRWVDENLAALVAESADQRRRFVETVRPAANDGGFAGARVKGRDPLALFAHDSQVKAEHTPVRAGDDSVALTGPDGSAGVASSIQGTIVAIDVAIGDEVRRGQQIAVIEAMKMEHVIT